MVNKSKRKSLKAPEIKFITKNNPKSPVKRLSMNKSIKISFIFIELDKRYSLKVQTPDSIDKLSTENPSKQYF